MRSPQKFTQGPPLPFKVGKEYRKRARKIRWSRCSSKWRCQMSTSCRIWILRRTLSSSRTGKRATASTRRRVTKDSLTTRGVRSFQLQAAMTTLQYRKKSTTEIVFSLKKTWEIHRFSSRRTQASPASSTASRTNTNRLRSACPFSTTAYTRSRWTLRTRSRDTKRKTLIYPWFRRTK